MASSVSSDFYAQLRHMQSLQQSEELTFLEHRLLH